MAAKSLCKMCWRVRIQDGRKRARFGRQSRLAIAAGASKVSDRSRRQQEIDFDYQGKRGVKVGAIPKSNASWQARALRITEASEGSRLAPYQNRVRVGERGRLGRGRKMRLAQERSGGERGGVFLLTEVSERIEPSRNIGVRSSFDASS